MSTGAPSSTITAIPKTRLVGHVLSIFADNYTDFGETYRPQVAACST